MVCDVVTWKGVRGDMGMVCDVVTWKGVRGDIRWCVMW